MTAEIRIDALLPAEMARRAEYLGERKSSMAFLPMLMLSILAGAFISMGAIFATTVSAGSMTINDAEGIKAFSTGLPYGVVRLLAGLVFSLGLILVVVGGAELFTGNNLIVMAWAGRKVTTKALLRNWLIVYVGNFIGAVGTALMVFISRQYTAGGNAVGAAALSTATAKASLDFLPALALGILCNALVCMAVWMTFSARSTMDKIAAIIFPITAFVAAGFEHSIANMYFIPIGLLIKNFDPETTQKIVEATKLNLDKLTLSNFIVNNLIPVTIGNIIGGAVLVAAVYWLIFLRNADR